MVAVGVVSKPAHAATVFVNNCAVSSILYRDSFLEFICVGSSTPYHGFAPGVGCPASQIRTLDTVKLWVGMVEAAMLSGKKLNFDYDDAGTCKQAVANLVLVQ